MIDRGSMLGKLGVKCIGEWYVGGSVPSSKNSRRVVRGSGGRIIVIGSKQLIDYKKRSVGDWMNGKGSFLGASKVVCKLPMLIEFVFIRGSRHKFDYINPAQTVQDLMTEYGWIEDDNSDVIVPYFGDYIFDKEYAGVVIRLFDGRGVIGNNKKITDEQEKGLFCEGPEWAGRGRSKRESVLDQAGGSSSTQRLPGGENDSRPGIKTGETDSSGGRSCKQDFYVGC